MENNISIYKLIDPETNEVRYVGKTIQKLSNRLASHISVSKKDTKKDYCHCWIKSLLFKGLSPIIKLIEETSDINRECYWINYYKGITKLTNFSDGGELGNVGKNWKLNPDKIKSKYSKKVYVFKDSILIQEFKSIKDFCLFFKFTDVYLASRIIKNKLLFNSNLYASFNILVDEKLYTNKKVIRYSLNNENVNLYSILDIQKILGIDKSTIYKKYKNTNSLTIEVKNVLITKHLISKYE